MIRFAYTEIVNDRCPSLGPRMFVLLSGPASHACCPVEHVDSILVSPEYRGSRYFRSEMTSKIVEGSHSMFREELRNRPSICCAQVEGAYVPAQDHGALRT